MTMFYRILRKDLKRKKAVNFILFLFIVIATVFLSSSLNNIYAVSDATNYFLDKTNIPDVIIVGKQVEGKDEIGDWLSSEQKYVKSFAKQEAIMISSDEVKKVVDGETKEYKTDSSIYIQQVPRTNVKVLDKDGNEFEVKDGEVALSVSAAEENHLKVGDQIKFDLNGKTYIKTISMINKDALYVGSLSGMIRLVISDNDYNEIRENNKLIKTNNYFVMTDDVSNFTKAYNKQSFETGVTLIERNTIKLLYVMDLIVAGLLSIIGVCLIVIAVLVLRFTIVFTIQEDYREIGIMKAIGIKNFGIKKVYIVKYFVLVCIGAILGGIVSFPVSAALLDSVSKTMLMEKSAMDGLINIVCMVGVTVLVLLLCYLSMRKLNKLSAIDAIRCGQTGERYKKKSIVNLHKRKRLSTPSFMAINDVVSNIKQYIVLLLVFTVGIVLIIIPVNTISTMKSTEMGELFGLDKDAKFYIRGIDTVPGNKIATTKDLENVLDKAEKELRDVGYDVKLSSSSVFFAQYYTNKEENTQTLLTTQPIHSDGTYQAYLEGTAPLLDNEIAASKKILDEFDLSVGDNIKGYINGKEQTFIITGTYQDYMQLGRSIRMNPTIDLSDMNNYEAWTTNVYLDSEKDTGTIIKDLKEKLPKYNYAEAQDIVNVNVGGVMNTVDGMKIWLVLLMAGINILIVSLMMKLFIVREKGEVAMLRSIGFRNISIRLWQTLRIAVVLVIAVVLAIPLSRLLDATILKSIFAIMGGEIKIQVDMLYAYVLYPIIMLISIVIAAYLCSASIKKIDIRELNNLE